MTCRRKARRLAESPLSAGDEPRPIPSLLFIWWALGLALTAGFAQGTALFVARTLGLPIDAWWGALAQAHGHIQLFGWAGMFALGVALHFLPRLRGCPPPSTRMVRVAAWLLGGGLALRAVAQPMAAALDDGVLRTLSGVGLVLSGLLELAGASLAVAAMLAVARLGPPLATRGALVAVLPFAAAFFATLLVGLAGNLAVLLDGVLAGRALASPAAGWTLTHLALVGMLVPISAAISARTFPAYLDVRVPARRELSATFTVLVVGIVARSLYPLDVSFVPVWLPSLGALLEGLAMLMLVVVLDMPLRLSRPRLEENREPVPSEQRAAAWLIVSAYVWLAIGGLLLVAEGLAGWGLAPAPPPDAERHALGAGLVTLLILGMAVRLLPGFAGRPLYSGRLVWATVWLGNVAALLRIAPLFLPLSSSSTASLAVSGLLALAAVGCLSWNLIRTLALPSVLPRRLTGLDSPSHQPASGRSPVSSRPLRV
jgi:uncharacterized protein involved in response to NO